MPKDKKIKSIKFYKNLYVNFMIVLLFVLLPVVMTLYINGQNFLREIKQYEYKTNLDLSYKTQAVFDNVLSGVNVSMQNLLNEEILLSFISEDDFYENSQNYEIVSSMLKGSIVSEEYVKNIQVYSKINNAIIDCQKGLIKEDDKTPFIDATFEWFNIAQIYSNKSLDIIGENGILWKVEPCIFKENSKGFIIYEIDFKALSRWLVNEDETFHKKDFFIINDYGEILFYNDENNIYRNVVEGMKCSQAILSAPKNSATQTEMLGHNVLLSRVDSN